MQAYVQQYAKAVVGALIAGLGVLATGFDGGLTGQEAVYAVIAALAGLGGVWAVPNKPKTETK